MYKYGHTQESKTNKMEKSEEKSHKETPKA